ncbi:MAG: cytochrome b5 domain-containing protein, partial [Chloroflexota bacterium]
MWRRITRSELRRCNGKGGSPAYVAYRGRVYDVSRSFLWQHGRHQALHSAGSDLTDSLADAPHSSRMLRRFP